MTPETKEALKGLAEAVKLLALGSKVSVHVRHRADRLIRALEQESGDRAEKLDKLDAFVDARQRREPLRRPTVNLILRDPRRADKGVHISAGTGTGVGGYEVSVIF